jgi:hypothetical protein
MIISAVGLLTTAQVAKADSVSPASYSQTITVSGSTTVHKVVTIDATPSTSAPVDVFLLSDTTGSMGAEIAAVQASAMSIISSTASLGDVQFGAGEYKDVVDTFVYRTDTDITSNSAAVQAGVNLWSAFGGGDLPEADLYGLDQVATTVHFRPGSTRILVWFGDAYGHDPSNGVTEAIATAALVAANIKVEALDLGDLDGAGQATRITAATNGNLFTGVSTSSIVTTITSAINAAISTYHFVTLDTSGVPPGLAVSLNPTGYTSLFTRASARTFPFDLSFVGAAPGTYTFTVPVLVDGGQVATESDTIIVSSPTKTPPTCALTAVISGPPKQLQITVQDADNGIANITVVEASNTGISIPDYTMGDKTPKVVVATKINQTQGASVTLQITDTNGAVTNCDPVIPGESASTGDSGGAPQAGCSVAAGTGFGHAGLMGGALLLGLALVRRRNRRG